MIELLFGFWRKRRRKTSCQSATVHRQQPAALLAFGGRPPPPLTALARVGHAAASVVQLKLVLARPEAAPPFLYRKAGRRLASSLFLPSPSSRHRLTSRILLHHSILIQLLGPVDSPHRCASAEPASASSNRRSHLDADVFLLGVYSAAMLPLTVARPL